MAKNILVSINMNKNEVQNPRVQNLAAAPSNPVAGQVYFNTVDKELKVYDGNNWKAVGDKYTLPVATNSVLGGVLAKIKENDDTVEVSVDANGKLYVPGYPVIPDWVGDTKPTYTADEVGAIPTTAKGSANGVATLDSTGKVPSSQLPSYVDDVIEGYYYNNKFYKESTHTTEITGETGKIYVDLTTEKTYRWSGSAYVEISQSTIHKYTGTITGDGTTTSFTITHSLGTKEVLVNIYDASTSEEIIAEVVRTSTSAITVSFAVAPTSETSYKVVVVA